MCLSAAGTFPVLRFRVERLPGMSDELYGMKTKVYSMCLERRLMEKANLFVPFAASLREVEDLSRSGVSYLYQRRQSSMVWSFVKDEIPLQVLDVLCRVARATNLFRLDLACYERVIQSAALDATALEKSINLQDKKTLELVFKNFRAFLLNTQAAKDWDEFEALASGMHRFGEENSNVSFSTNTKRILSEWKVRREAMRKLDNLSDLEGKEDRFYEQCSAKRREIDSASCSEIITAITLYGEEMKNREREYGDALESLKKQIYKECHKTSYVKICSPEERRDWSALIFLESLKFGEFIVKTDVSTVIEKKYLAQQVKDSFLPEGLSKNPFCEKVSKVKKVCTCKREPNEQSEDVAAEESSLLAADIQPSPVSEIKVEPQSTQSEIPSVVMDDVCCLVSQQGEGQAKRKEKRRKKHERTSSEVASRATTLGLSIFAGVYPGVGPDVSIKYAWHVARWHPKFNFDPLTQDCAYASQSFTLEGAEIMRSKHLLGRAIDQVLLRTKPFVKLGPTGTPIRWNHCMLGEIRFPSGKCLKGVFQETRGVDRRTVIHRYFKEGSAEALIQSYAQEGTFLRDIEEDENLLPAETKGYMLEDDGSRISRITEKCVEVLCPGGEILVAMPLRDV